MRFFSYIQRLEYDESEINYFVIQNQSKCTPYPFVIRIMIFVIMRCYIKDMVTFKAEDIERSCVHIFGLRLDYVGVSAVSGLRFLIYLWQLWQRVLSPNRALELCISSLPSIKEVQVVIDFFVSLYSEILNIWRQNQGKKVALERCLIVIRDRGRGVFYDNITKGVGASQY